MIRPNYESDAGKRKFMSHKELGTVPHVPFEEYSEMLKHCFIMKRKNVTGESRGNVIQRKSLSPLAPSTFAASTTDRGML